MNLDLDAIRQRAEAASPGPWAVNPVNGYQVKLNNGTGFLVAHTHRLTDNKDLRDAEFIAHAREDIPALVAEVERLRNELSAARRYGRTA